MPTTRTTRRTKGAVLAPVYDDPMPRKQRSRATSVASSQRSTDRSHDPAPALNALSRLTSHNEELAAENDDLRRELEKSKTKRWTLRDKQLASQLAEHRTQQSVESESEPLIAKQPKVQTPARSSRSEHRQEEPAAAAATPARSSPPPTTTPTSVPRWRQFLSSFTGFTPFSARRPAEPATEPARRLEQSPLGQLPQNRKRSAPAARQEGEEDETPLKHARASGSEAEQEASLTLPPQSSPSKQLETISEQSEPANQQSKKKPIRPSTPTRASRRKVTQTPQTEKITKSEMVPPSSSVSKRRTIRDARQSREPSTAPLSQSARPLKRWDAPPKPRELNADKRLARMQQLEKLKLEKERMEQEIARLAEEQEADGIDTRKRKRVKVDELAYIPHNQPGDAVGTFRVPDWDSDDEMEVDDEVPVRKNVFVANAEKEAHNLQTAQQPPQPERVYNLQPSQPPPPPPAKTVTDTANKPKPLFTPPTAAAQSTTLPPASLFKPTNPATVSKPQPVADEQEQRPQKLQPTPLFKPAAQPDPPAAKTATANSKKNFAWPSVGNKATGDAWPEQKKIAASQKFARGFEAWSAVSLQAH